MKKILIVLLFLISLNSAYSQKDTLVYQTITDFRLDTVQFIRYNFVERAKCYENSSFADFYANLNMKPIMMGVGYAFKEDGTRVFSGVRLYLGKYDDKNRFIQIVWQDPQSMPREADMLMKRYGIYKWLERYVKLFGDYKIASVYTDETLFRRN